jgi:branched-chain amino acid transport system substrate-binding protein
VARALAPLPLVVVSASVAVAVSLAASSAVRADVVVAVPVPLEGAKAGTGRAIVAAAKDQAERLNRTGGILGEPIRITAFEDGCDGAQAAETAKRLAALRPAAVIGHPCGNAAVAAAPIYAGADILFLTPGVREAALTSPRAGPTIFRVSGRDDRQGQAAARFLISRYKGKRIAIVHDRTRLMRALANGVRSALAGRDVPVALSTTIVAAEKDYMPLLAELRSHGIDVLYFAGFPAEAARIIEQTRSAGLSVAFAGPDVLATAEFGEEISATGAASAVWLTRPARFSARSGATCDVMGGRAGEWVQRNAALLTCAAFEAWSSAVKAAGSPESAVISASLESTIFQTVIGPLSFEVSGDARVPSYDVVVWRRGSWRGAPAAAAK